MLSVRIERAWDQPGLWSMRFCHICRQRKYPVGWARIRTLRAHLPGLGRGDEVNAWWKDYFGKEKPNFSS